MTRKSGHFIRMVITNVATISGVHCKSRFNENPSKLNTILNKMFVFIAVLSIRISGEAQILSKLILKSLLPRIQN